MSWSASGKATRVELEAGYSTTLVGAVVREVKKAARATGRTWAACLRRIFEVDPVKCDKCGGVMELVAMILDDQELKRILAHQGWAVDFPKTKASRSPPVPAGGDESQVDPEVEKWEGREDPAGDWPA